MVLGLYYISRDRVNAQCEGHVFADTKEVMRALGNKQVHIHARVKVRVHEVVKDLEGNVEERTFIADTTPGRCKLWLYRAGGSGLRHGQPEHDQEGHLQAVEHLLPDSWHQRDLYLR